MNLDVSHSRMTVNAPALKNNHLWSLVIPPLIACAPNEQVSRVVWRWRLWTWGFAREQNLRLIAVSGFDGWSSSVFRVRLFLKFSKTVKDAHEWAVPLPVSSGVQCAHHVSRDGLCWTEPRLLHFADWEKKSFDTFYCCQNYILFPLNGERNSAGGWISCKRPFYS